jgi:hypothetical protein
VSGEIEYLLRSLQLGDVARIVLEQDSTLIAVIEMSLSRWLVAGIVPGIMRQPNAAHMATWHR